MHRGRAGFLALGGYCLQTINRRAPITRCAPSAQMHRALRAKSRRSARDENPLVLERIIHAWACCTVTSKVSKLLPKMTLNKVLNPYNANHCDSQKPNYTTAMHRIALFLSCSSVFPHRPPTVPWPRNSSLLDPATGDLGVAVQSKFFESAPSYRARAGIGAVATQSYANTTYGLQVSSSWLPAKRLRMC